jgi:peptide/nickel transport system substrate-binding protein
MLVAIACCSPTRRRTPDDTLVLVLQNQATTVDPRYTLSNYDAALGKLVAPGLTSVETTTAEPQLELASAITRVDPLTVDITIADAKFSDGAPVTATDVARTYQAVLDPKCESLYQKGFAERYASFDVLDDRHVRFHLAIPLGTLMTDLEFGIVSYRGVPPGQCHGLTVIGAGPYILRELTPYGAELDANPYYRAPPKLPHLKIVFATDPSARILMLVGGSADLLENAVRGDLVTEVGERSRVRIEAAPSLVLTYMLLNNDDPILRDHRVREAIALALDRPAVIEARFEGRAVLATGLLPPSHWAYNADVPTWNRDLPRARALLDEAGHRPGPDGVRLHLVYKTSADLFRVAIAHVLASQLAEVGISVEVRPFEFGTFFADIKKGNYQIATMQTTPITEPDFYYSYFHSTRIPSDADRDAQNRWHYRNADLDRVTLAGRQELDRAKRKVLYAEAQRLVARDLPIIPLWHEDNVVLSNVDVQGYTIVPDGRFAGLPSVTKH